MQQQKKYDFGTLTKLLFITANQIAYPQTAPANTSQKINQNKTRKYSFFDYRNITDNQGWLPIKIDYKNFKPKKYFKDTQEQVLQKHLNAIQKKQNLLKQFKHYQDFDRIDYLASERSNTFQNHIDKMIISHFGISVIFSRIFTISAYSHHYANGLWFYIFKKTYLYTFPFLILAALSYQSTNPINHQYFRMLPKDVRMYQNMAYDMDAFQNVNDIKYNFKYPQRTDFYKTVWSVYDKMAQSKQYDAMKYYKRVYGLVDPEPFWNKNKQNLQKQNI